MKHCISCNKELTNDSKYCNECGKNQSTGKHDNQDNNYTRQPLYAAKPEYRENSDYQNANNFHLKRKYNPIFVLCLTVIVVVVVLGFISNKDKSDEVKKTSISSTEATSHSPTTIKTEPPKSDIVAKLHQKVTVPDSIYGTYEVTINSIKQTAERNKYSKSVPVEVYKINYTYKLLSKGTSSRGLYLSSFDSFDSTGEAGEGYPDRPDSDPKVLTLIGSRCSADIFIAVKNKSTFLNLVLDYNVTNDRAYITFKIPTK